MMFEIQPDDIAALEDGDLRALVGLLCEAELRAHGLSASAVTWGGNQDARDGGIDVRVSLPGNAAVDGFVPKPESGYQVKKPDMAAADITKEMRPKGQIRPAIKELAERGGAYVIVSSGSSVTDSALKERLAAMAEAVKGIPNADSLTLDFFDRSRIATWVRSRPGWIPWVRERVGKRIQGWQSYGAWSNPAEETKADYLIDDQIKIRTSKSGEGLSVVTGLERVRDSVRDPRKVARIVGLSGVGKTRFVQALFDERLGAGCLDPSLALYTNLADDPDPNPISLISDLVALRTRAIVVVDNCPPDLHRRLSEVCRKPESSVSLLTVEYDIRADQPEETEVFRLEPSSGSLIEKLIRGRFKHISMIDAGTIARFSGGNARVAIALANTVKKNDTLAGLNDDVLFKRLFEQAHGHDENLLLIAQACALVYSFQGEGTAEQKSELHFFAKLTGTIEQQIHRAVAELKRRDLVQSRSVWRAVLPHAIANRLAKAALENIPLSDIEQQLQVSERLLKSFSRRLGYLHDSPEAVLIAESWLGPSGLLGDLGALNDLGREMFSNVAPASPSAVLEAVGRCSFDQIASRVDIVRAVRSIAYDAARFDLCVDILARLSEARGPQGDRSDAASSLVSLFTIMISGTHATPEQRLRAVEGLLRSESRVRQKLGLEALRETLKTSHFSASHSFEFGARPRDYGYEPRGDDDVRHWYGSALCLIEKLMSEVPFLESQLGTVLASSFRGLWTLGLVADDLDRVCRLFATKGFWREGWIAVRRTWQYDRRGMPEDLRAKLHSLDKALAPVGLAEDVQAVVLGGEWADFDTDDLSSANVERASRRREEKAFELGATVGGDWGTLEKLLPEVVSGNGDLWNFGRGLAEGTNDQRELWKQLSDAYAAVAVRQRKTRVLEGFLNGVHGKAPELANQLLDESLTDACLGESFPRLQTAIVIDKQGVERLKDCLKLGITPIGEFIVLAYGRATEPISGEDLRDLITLVASQPDGQPVALEVLYMRLFSEVTHKKVLPSELIQAGCDLLKMITFKKRAQKQDDQLAGVARACLASEPGKEAFQVVSRNFMAAVASHDAYAFEYEDFLQALFEVRPFEALDVFVGGHGRTETILTELVGRHKNPLEAAPNDIIIHWCERAPAERYSALARVIGRFESEKDENPVSWHPIALKLIEHAPDAVSVLKELVQGLRPRSWTGSRASRMEAGLPLLEGLEQHPNPAVVEFSRQDSLKLKQEIEDERRRELKRGRDSDERFE